jgi:phospholipid/cholesterol/gamma-HCH transport system ATP-binding protein
VIVTHEVPEIFSLCDNVAMLYKGKILIEGPPEDILGSRDPVVNQFIRGELEGPLHLI